MPSVPGAADVAVRRARELLGVTDSTDADQLRAAYHRLLLRTHPDLSGAGDATERTVELTRAYQLLQRDVSGRQRSGTDRSADDPTGATAPPAATAASTASDPADSASRSDPSDTDNDSDAVHDVVTVELLDDQTIAIGAPPSETLLILMEAANRLGEISYLDPSAGLIEVVVEFIEAPTSSVLLSMQGRATGVTEVFCTVEPLSGGEAPPSDAVTRLLQHTLVEVVGEPQH